MLNLKLRQVTLALLDTPAAEGVKQARGENSPKQAMFEVVLGSKPGGHPVLVGLAVHGRWRVVG